MFKQLKDKIFKTPTALSWEGWQKWKKKARKKHPFLWWLTDTMPGWFRGHYHTFDRKWYYLKCKLFKKYNRVIPRGLDPTWCDRDTLLLHASFEILCDFVEGELIDSHVNWNWSFSHRKAYQEFWDLYTWWTKDRPLRDKRDPMNKRDRGHGFMCKCEECRKTVHDGIKFEDDCLKEDQDMLHRLIEVRGFMWT